MITPQQLAQIAQLLQSLLHSHAGVAGPHMPQSVPSPMAAPHGTVGPGRALLPTRSRPSSNPAPSGRAPTVDRETRTLPRIESAPSSASSAYMSMARPIPGPSRKKMTWPGLVRSGAGNFGMA